MKKSTDQTLESEFWTIYKGFGHECSQMMYNQLIDTINIVEGVDHPMKI